MKVYFAGSIRAGRGNQHLCEKAIKEIQKYAMVLTEHVGDPNLSERGEFDKTEAYIYNRDMAWLEEADAVVSEVTVPSLGVGYEIANAERSGKPVLCLYNTELGRYQLSAMLMGAAEKDDALLEVMNYEKPEDLELIIQNFFVGINK